MKVVPLVPKLILGVFRKFVGWNGGVVNCYVTFKGFLAINSDDVVKEWFFDVVAEAKTVSVFEMFVKKKNEFFEGVISVHRFNLLSVGFLNRYLLLGEAANNSQECSCIEIVRQSYNHQ